MRASADCYPRPVVDPDPNILVFVIALERESAPERVDAASSLSDLMRGEVHAEDYARVVSALLRCAGGESDPEALEAMLYTASEAADRPGSGERADWDPLVPLLKTVEGPECLGYVLTALGLARHERYRAPITPFLAHVHPNVREAAAGAIAELDHRP